MGLPSVSLPFPSPLGRLGGELLRDPVARLDRVRELPDVRALRLTQARRLLRTHRDLLEADPRGEPVVRREILAWSPSPAGLAAAAAAGLTVLRENRLEGLDEVVMVLKVPEMRDTALLLDQLRKLDPEGTYDFNHVYIGSGAAGAAAPAGAATGVDGTAGAARVGLVDSGVDAGHDVFSATAITRWGCGEVHHPHFHGTAVAALLVGRSRQFRGVAPQARLYAADIYCNSATGGSADRIAAALAWMAREKVPVINLSIVGPSNQTLERVVGTMVRRGHLLVAAVGNDGPAAPPLYPASYPGVVGVSAVDKRGRVLPEAGRGPQVMFAAPGNHMVSAAPGAPPYRQVRGTSFAAPIVAGLLADGLSQPDRTQAAAAVAALARQALREDGTSASNESGLGVVGQAFRIDPATLR
ncbi:S8 family serine peptidase [Massilia sp. PAMC28688]|nr:S8 family serine peptidase [Massilia sp. PAMC28688]